MIIKKLGPVWVAYASYGGKLLHCTASSWTKANHMINDLMVKA